MRTGQRGIESSTSYKRGRSLPAGVAGTTLYRVRVLFTARMQRLALIPQVEAILPMGYTAKGSRRAL
jgi:hypothetical protein